MRPLTIDLDQLAFALNTEGLDHYLDLLSGKVLLIPEEDADPELETLLREEPERFLLVEPLGQSDELRLMEEFLPEVVHPHAYAALQQALAGRKPARSFRHVLMEYPVLLEAWHAFEATRLRELAQDWLEDNELKPATPLH
ncbi:UPF0158 family protein [Metapseudomonas resinovorans]|uniref:Uncharacterized protein n=1 Tax=Metapseudomonas resinovorans NBRC 106553 TaxID=1245471 RepID=S6APK3_METRE|nr:UPF0158 family protein [Pseudomonas resinovorans]BAN51025.1 hypothetical protein PCA10_52930 [Pseudomonas resinovorans NBRC 106553]